METIFNIRTNNLDKTSYDLNIEFFAYRLSLSHFDYSRTYFLVYS